MKGNVELIVSDPHLIELHARFTMVPLTVLLSNNEKEIIIFSTLKEGKSCQLHLQSDFNIDRNHDRQF